MATNRSWIWVDTLLAVVRFIYYLTGVAYFIQHPEEMGMSYGLFFLWFTICILAPHLFWRPGYINDVIYAITELTLVGLFHIYFIFYVGTAVGVSLLFMPALILGYLGRKNTHIFSFIVLSFLTISIYNIEPRFMSIATYFFALAVLFAFGYIFNNMLNTQRKMKLLLEENLQKTALIEAQNKALEQYTRKVEELTLEAERNRMAGELHDTIGHTFTSVIVGMDAVSYLIDLAPEKAKERLAVLREVTTGGLNQLREQIHNIAIDDEQLSLSSKLEKIALEFSDYTNTEVTIQTFGHEQELSKSVSLILNRCLQESLTNAKRHGEASKIDIQLVFKDGELKLTIQDNGKGSSNLKQGFGLQTMKDRLSQVNGSLIIQSEENLGTTVICMIPLKGVGEIEKNKTVARG
ncbi:sensor histidine kinase [Bacillus sp. FJAT-29814]|uniref:sensor histidine kinase n=1 Tax=Bacillus sp. FJAT-29814 TaxID=1729688 RepID=UPI00082CF0CC|nr:sensor histidine kinase [Bacillus sp. FJAT-29814]